MPYRWWTRGDHLDHRQLRLVFLRQGHGPIKSHLVCGLRVKDQEDILESLHFCHPFRLESCSIVLRVLGTQMLCRGVPLALTMHRKSCVDRGIHSLKAPAGHQRRRFSDVRRPTARQKSDTHGSAGPRTSYRAAVPAAIVPGRIRPVSRSERFTRTGGSQCPSRDDWR